MSKKPPQDISSEEYDDLTVIYDGPVENSMEIKLSTLLRNYGYEIHMTDYDPGNNLRNLFFCKINN